MKTSLTLILLALPLTVIAEETVPLKNEHPGAKIYRRMCAECHGKLGEGVAGKQDEPLVGDRSIPSLTKYISSAMPFGKEGTCVGDDAANVAAFIFDAFYSPAAQARNNPVRENLARLTVDQYRNSVADLLGRFRNGFDLTPGPERGLQATYSGWKPEFIGPLQSPEQNKVEPDPKKRKRERVSYEQMDEAISFHFGAESPDPVRLAADGFRTVWQGAIIAPETGTYEFIAKSENGLLLGLNGNPTLIDGSVTSGSDVREEKRSIFLLGGRAYPMGLIHSKINDKTGSIELLWKPPHGRVSVIPKSQFIPGRPFIQGRWPVTTVVTTGFPADDRSDGYDRGTTISKEWDASTTSAALEVAAHVDKNLGALAGTGKKAPDYVEKLKSFARRFVEAAFRRPLTKEQFESYVGRQFQEAPTPEFAVKRVVLLTLKSPQFLYPELVEDEKFDDWSIASRLALNLWDSIPDPRLAKAAAEGRLHTREQVEQEAQRMVADPRAKAKLRGFFRQWLELERAEATAKDSKAFPGFDETMLADLRESLWRFIDEVVWSPQSDYRQLVSADYLWLNERLGKYYGKPVQGEEFQRVAFDPGQRAGVITHPYLLAAFSYSRTSSPIHRGVFLSRNIVGLALKNPSVAVAFDQVKFDPTLTMREKVAQLTKNSTCMGCHSSINPLGFSLEHFDAVGRWRMKDNNKPVDADAEFDTDDGRVVKLSGPRDIADYVVNSETAHRAFVRQLFNYTTKQPNEAFGESTLATLRRHFAVNDFNIQKLLAEIAVMASMHDPAFTTRTVDLSTTSNTPTRGTP